MVESVKLFHVTCAVMTVLFFAGRGVAMLRNAASIERIWVRRTAESIDTLLFFSGVWLIWQTGQLPWQTGWLGMKLLLLVVYILLGMVSFHWASRRNTRIAAWLMALTTFAIIVWMAVERPV